MAYGHLQLPRLTGEVSQTKAEDYCAPAIAHFEKGNFIVVISSDKMGEGDDELGNLLMIKFYKGSERS